ncbi:UNVERIFIED_CONTAM: hypothetical protein K2H54_042116 [Gekko kuhli]
MDHCVTETRAEGKCVRKSEVAWCRHDAVRNPPQVTHDLASPCKIQDVKEFGLKSLLLEHSVDYGERRDLESKRFNIDIFHEIDTLFETTVHPNPSSPFAISCMNFVIWDYFYTLLFL